MREARRYSRRGVSAVVTTLLMVVATGIIGSALAAWSNSSFAIQSSQISNQTASRINLVKESLVLEDVWFYTKPVNNPYANVTIRNTGDLAITVSKIYVNNTQVWSGNQIITIGSIATIPDVPVGWHSNSMQSVWIHTARGTDVKQVWKS
jgi:hypothetical protein